MNRDKNKKLNKIKPSFSGSTKKLGGSSRYADRNLNVNARKNMSRRRDCS